MRFKIYPLLIIAALLAACEEQPVLIPDFVVPETDKVVLIEELTGVSCPNCPAGAAIVSSILDQFEGLVVAIGIHGELQAEPKSNSKYDFRNQDALDLENELRPFWGKPAAAINRVFFEGEDNATTTSRGLWASFVEQELQKPQQVGINITSDYNESTRVASFNISVSTLVEIPGDIQLHVAITESHLIDPQDDINVTIQEYEHNHVLKELVTQLSGDGIGSNLSANQILNRPYSYTIPAASNGEWNPDNMEVIAFVTSTALDGEVLQAASNHLK